LLRKQIRRRRCFTFARDLLLKKPAFLIWGVQAFLFQTPAEHAAQTQKHSLETYGNAADNLRQCWHVTILSSVLLAAS
jgi:hypothetical protein